MTLALLDEPATFAAQIAHLKSQHVDLDVDGIYFDVSFSFTLLLRNIQHCCINKYLLSGLCRSFTVMDVYGANVQLAIQVTFY